MSPRPPLRLAVLSLSAALLLVGGAGCRSRAAAPAITEPVGTFRFSPRKNRAAEIHWQAWSKAAFERARAEHKPLLLSLAAVWCHWCHVLDETTLSDPRVIALLNRDFVALRVDADQRPDVEQRYLLGGWPTVAFLDEEGEILDGGTYVPPEGFLAMAERAKQSFLKPAGTAGRTQPPRSFDPTRPGALDAVVEGVVRGLEASVDLEHGGFGRQPKFPSGEAVRVLLAVGEKELAKKALDGMLRLEDPVEGGFYRYAMKADWSSPHYEKMLYGEADLLAAYAAGARVLGDARYTAAARRTVEYVRRTLTAPDGSFYASQDADEAYSAMGAAGRRAHGAPYVDKTLLVDRNGKMIAALVSAARDLGDASLLDDAARAGAVLGRLQDERGAFFHDRKEGAPSPELPGMLADQAWGALALVALSSARGEPVPQAARAALAYAEAKLRNPRGGYFDSPEPSPRGEPGSAFGRLRRREKPFDDNAAIALAQLAAGDRAAAERTLTAFAGAFPLFGTEAALYARAVMSLQAPTAPAPPQGNMGRGAPVRVGADLGAGRPGEPSALTR